MSNFKEALNSFIVDGKLDEDWFLNDIELHVTNVEPVYKKLLDTSVPPEGVALEAITATLNNRVSNVSKLTVDDVKQGLSTELGMDMYKDILTKIVSYIKDLRFDYMYKQDDDLEESVDNSNDLIIDTVNKVKQDNLESGLVSEDEFVLQCYDKYRELSNVVDIPKNVKLDIQQYAKEVYRRIMEDDLNESKDCKNEELFTVSDEVKQDSIEKGLYTEEVEVEGQAYIDTLKDRKASIERLIQKYTDKNAPQEKLDDLNKKLKDVEIDIENEENKDKPLIKKESKDLSTDKYTIEVVKNQPDISTYDSEEDYEADKKYYENGQVFRVVDKETGEEEFVYGEEDLQDYLEESNNKLTESNTEKVSFQEIIEMMENAEDYEELYTAAQLIVDTQLESEVILQIRTCEDDGDDVDTAYSVVTSDLLDNLAMQGYKNIPNVYSQLDESKGTTKSFEDVLGLNPYDVNYENDADALNIVNKFKAKHKLDDLFDYIVSITTHPFLSEQDYLDFLSVIDLSKLDLNNDAINESSKNKDEDIINQLVNMGMTQDQARHTYKSLCNLFNNRIKSIDNNAELIEENLEDYQDKLSVEYMSKIFKQMRKNGWDGKPETVEKYFSEIINKIDPNAKEDKVAERESVDEENTVKISEEELRNRYNEYITEEDPDTTMSYDEFKQSYLNDVMVDGKHLELENKKLEESRNIIWTDHYEPSDEELQNEYNEYTLDEEDPESFEDWLQNYEPNVEAYNNVVMSEFTDVVFPMIENQCNHNTLILDASIGRWNGTFKGGKIITADLREFQNVLSVYDEVNILDTDSGIQVEGIHHDGTDRFNLYTLPENLTPLARAMGYEDIVKEDNDEEIIEKYGMDIMISDELSADIANQYVDDEEMLKHTDLLVPIKNTGLSIVKQESLTEAEDDMEDMLSDVENNIEVDESILDLLQDRIGQNLTIGQLNTLLQSTFGQFNTVFLQANELYNQDPDELQELVVWDDTDMYTITYEIIDQMQGVISITDVTVE